MELEWHRATGAARTRWKRAHRGPRHALRTSAAAAPPRAAAPPCSWTANSCGAGRRERADAPGRLRAPGGRLTRKRFTLPEGAPAARVCSSSCVPAPQLWSPDARASTRRSSRCETGIASCRSRSGASGLRSVGCKAVSFISTTAASSCAASIHEDMPGSGAALTSAGTDRIVADLKTLGANITRAHYLLNARLLSRLDRAGIMVWSQAPIWQRDAGAHLLWQRKERARALETVRRTVTAARSPPSVLTHSVANELSFTPDNYPGPSAPRRRAGGRARHRSRLPISVDIKGARLAEQFTYGEFDMLGFESVFRLVSVGRGLQCPRALHL